MIGRSTESKAVREEAYMYVSAVYNPEHPLVLENGGKLITILVATGEFYDAERFARVCYDGLTRAPRENDPEGGDIIEAEMLARKAVHIMKEFKGPFSKASLLSCKVFFNIILFKKDFTDETKSLLEDYLSDAIRYEGVDGESTALAHSHLALFHSGISDKFSCKDTERKHLQIAVSHFKEELRISIILFGPNSPNALQVTST